MFLPLLPLFGVLATAADLSNAGTTQAYEPGIYVLKSMEVPGKGKHLAYRSSDRTNESEYLVGRLKKVK